MKPWERFQKVENIDAEVANLNKEGDTESAAALQQYASMKPWEKFKAKPAPQEQPKKSLVDDYTASVMAQPEVGGNFLAGFGNAVTEDAMGLGQLVGLVDKKDVDAQRAKFSNLKDDPSFNVGGVTGKLADVFIPGGAAKNFGGYIPKLGPYLSRFGDMLVTPKGAGEALSGGAILGLTQPTGTGDNALANAGASGLISGAIPGAIGMVGKAGNYAMQHTPTNSALKQIKEVFNDAVPNTAPTAGNRYEGLSDVTPTVAMLTEDPAFRLLEQNARVRNPGKFAEKDANNVAAVYSGLSGKALSDTAANQAQDVLNATTGPLREQALLEANMAGGFNDPVMAFIGENMAKPGVRGSSATAVLSKADKQTGFYDVQAEDLYTLKKELGDALNLKTISADELSNATKSNRRLTTDLMGLIDDSINTSSGGKWADYLAQHSEGMKPIESGRAIQNILDKFDTARTINGVPNVTPSALRRAVENETYKNLGKTGWVDKLTPEARKTVDASVQAMNDIERAKAGVMATSGSQTTPLLSRLMTSSFPKGGLLGSAIDWARNAGIRTSNGLLDDAASDPVLMQQLLDKYHANGVVGPYQLPMLARMLSAPSAAGVSYVSQQ